MPLVSVLMPSYNYAKFLPEAIESVLGQTFRDFELIIIDDGSKDGSQQIIKNYGIKDERVRAKYHHQNEGISKTFNELIEMSKGKFLSPIASDDVWVEDKLKKQVEIMEKDDNLIIWSEGEIIDNESQPTGEKFTQMYEVIKKDGQLFDKLLSGNFIYGSSMMYKKENLKDIRIDENLKYLNDHKFFLDLAYRYDFHFITEPISKYRVHGKNTRFSDREGWYKDYLLLGKRITEDYGDKLSSNGNKKRVFHLIFTTPLHNAMKQDPWNKYNFIYCIILPFYCIYLLFKSI